MKANEVIACYVHDVAMLLPRKQRNDVAFELHALLDEELQGRAEAAGRAPDADMALALVRDFGRPADVAARYRPGMTIIDPEDGPAFFRSSVIGLVVIWCAGLLHVRERIATGDVLHALAQWWFEAVIPSLWWPGMLVLGFGGAAWARRRWPQSSEWTPRSPDRIQGSRATLVLGIIGILCGVYVLSEPRWVLDVFWGGHAAPVAYDALTYTDTFRHRQAPWLFGLLLLYVPLLGAVIVQGRWTPMVRRVEMVLGLVLCVVMAWTVLDGPAFLAAASDRMFKAAMVISILATFVGYAIKRYRRLDPTPQAQKT